MLADSFIKGNEVQKPTSSQNLAIPGPSQQTQRNYPIRNSQPVRNSQPIRNSQQFKSYETSQAGFQTGSTKSMADFRRSQRNNSYNTQKSIAPQPPRQNTRTLRGQSTQKLMSKDPTLAQVSLPSPIYGLEEAGFENSEKNPVVTDHWSIKRYFFQNQS